MSENVKNMEGETEASKNNIPIDSNDNIVSTSDKPPITILIGPNGSGKTTYIRNKKKKFDPKDIFSLDTEELTFLHNKTTSPFEKEIKEIANKLIERELEKEMKIKKNKINKGLSF